MFRINYKMTLQLKLGMFEPVEEICGPLILYIERVGKICGPLIGYIERVEEICGPKIAGLEP